MKNFTLRWKKTWCEDDVLVTRCRQRSGRKISCQNIGLKRRTNSEIQELSQKTLLLENVPFHVAAAPWGFGPLHPSSPSHPLPLCMTFTPCHIRGSRAAPGGFGRGLCRTSGSAPLCSAQTGDVFTVPVQVCSPPFVPSPNHTFLHAFKVCFQHLWEWL